MEKMIKRQNRLTAAGFTLIELILIVVIIGIAALMAIPTVSNAADMQVRSAANRLAADLDYAKGLAIAHQRPCAVVFYPDSESYDIRWTDTDEIVENPTLPGRDFVVNFAAEGSLKRVNLYSTGFASNTITFDYLGSPYNGKGTEEPLNSGCITLKADVFTLYVDVEPVTGYVTIRDS